MRRCKGFSPLLVDVGERTPRGNGRHRCLVERSRKIPCNVWWGRLARNTYVIHQGNAQQMPTTAVVSDTSSITAAPIYSARTHDLKPNEAVIIFSISTLFQHAYSTVSHRRRSSVLESGLHFITATTMASIMAQRAGVSSVASSRASRPSRTSVVAPRAALLTQVGSAALAAATCSAGSQLKRIYHRSALVGWAESV
jgi:hypothetical protein